MLCSRACCSLCRVDASRSHKVNGCDSLKIIRNRVCASGRAGAARGCERTHSSNARNVWRATHRKRRQTWGFFAPAAQRKQERAATTAVVVKKSCRAKKASSSPRHFELLPSRPTPFLKTKEWESRLETTRCGGGVGAHLSLEGEYNWPVGRGLVCG
jgi:hypothetical protein